MIKFKDKLLTYLNSISKAEWIAIALGVFFRFAVCAIVFKSCQGVVEDTSTYVNPALELLSNGRFFANGSPEIIRTPVYPLFLALCILISKSHYRLVAMILQHVINLAVFFAWRKIIYLYVKNKKLSFVLECAYLFNMANAYYASILITDNLYQDCIIVLCLLLCLFWKNPKLSYMISAGALLGASALLRPVSLYLPFALFVGLLFVYCVKKQLVKGLKYAGIFLLCACVFIVGWSFRNYYQCGKFTVSTIGDRNIYTHNSVAIVSDLTGEDYNTIVAERYYSDFTDEDIQEAKQLILNHKALYLKECGIACAKTFLYPAATAFLRCIPGFNDGLDALKSILYEGGGIKNTATSAMKYLFTDNPLFIIGIGVVALEIILLAAILVLFIVSLFGKYRDIKWYERWTLIGIVAYFVVTSSFPVMVEGYPRFRQVFIYPVLLICTMFVEKILVFRNDIKLRTTVKSEVQM